MSLRVLLTAVLCLWLSAARAQTASLTLDLDTGTSASPEQRPTEPAAPNILLSADQMPSFPGGEEGLVKFLKSRLQYPEAALAHSVSGKVHVTFTVDPAGHLHDPRVLKGLGYGLDEEAIRLVRLMPWWTPGKHQGQPAWVQVTMPIVFRAL